MARARDVTAVLAVVGAAVAAAAAYATRRRELFMGADEGYLWYGTQRLLAGEQPVRDFRAYEPGRYWLAAAVVRWSGGDEVVAVRAALHALLGVGLGACGLAWAHAGAPVPGLLLAPLVLACWSVRPHKVADLAVLLLAAAGGTALLDSVPGGALAAGIAVGVAGTVGLNLGLYATTQLVVVVATGVLTGRVGPADLALVGLGLVVGSAPLVAWFVRHDGTLAALHHARVTVPRGRGSTNLPLPVPWPWRAVPLRGPGDRLLHAALRWALVVVPAVAVGLAAALLASPGTGAEVRVVPLAAVGLASLHHAASRADVAHLSLPLGLLVVVPLVATGTTALVAAVPVVAASVLVVRHTHPRLLRLRRPDLFARRRLHEQPVWLPSRDAALLDAVDDVARTGEAIAVLPFGVWVLAARRTTSAVTDTYAVYAASPEEDEAMCAELDAARPVLVVVDDRPLDEREERRFSRTHPVTWAWLQRVGTVVPLPRGPDGVRAAVTARRVGAR